MEEGQATTGYAEIGSEASDGQGDEDDDEDDYDEEGYGALDQEDQIRFGDDPEPATTNKENAGWR